jgi:hypothetical protein
MEPPKGPDKIWGWLAPLSWIITSKSLTIVMICNKCIIPNYSHPSWHGKVCFNIWKGRLWTIIMSLGMPMKFNLKSDGYIGPPIMTRSLGGLWPTSGATTTFNVSLASGSRSANGSGATESGGTTRGGGARASINARGPLPTFNQVVEFFHEL